jgi:putative MATE family efflux protein
LAVALLISGGGAANMSLNLGRGDRDTAERVIGNAIVLAVSAGIIILVIGEVFNTPLLRLFGATDAILPYAVDYSRIYIIGIPFTTMGIVMNDIIRADGNPAFSMITMLAGCITNIVLDYIFVFPLQMGVQGAALATIIGQILTFVMAILYMPRRLRTVSVRKKNLRLNGEICGKIFSLGVSAAVNQITMLIVQIILNQSIIRYGAMSKFGADIPITVFGIVMKVNQIMMSVIMGICGATQPLFGYNYGANKLKRVKSIFKMTTLVTFIIGLLGMACLQLFPEQIVSIFGQENELYNEFAVTCFHVMTVFIFVMGFQILSSIYFQSVGKAKNAIVLSLSRQFMFLLPCILILPLFFGIYGIMASYPVSDVLALILTIVLVVRESGRINKAIAAGCND